MNAKIHTDHGTMTVEFFEQDAPKTVANFVKLAREGVHLVVLLVDETVGVDLVVLHPCVGREEVVIAVSREVFAQIHFPVFGRCSLRIQIELPVDDVEQDVYRDVFLRVDQQCVHSLFAFRHAVPVVVVQLEYALVHLLLLDVPRRGLERRLGGGGGVGGHRC